MKEDSKLKKNKRTVRSYVLRQGHMTVGQKRALETLWDQYGLNLTDGLMRPAEIFARQAPLVLEIGFGMGASLVSMAQAHPDYDYIGIDVHQPGVGALLAKIEKHALNNIRVYCDDAIAVLKQCVAEQSLDTVQVFFPDPWPKKRHHKRRLIQTEFVELLLTKLKPGGVLHCATDWQNYAEHMMQILTEIEGLSNIEADHCYAQRPAHRPVTKFEERGQRLGHGVWDLIFVRS